MALSAVRTFKTSSSVTPLMGAPVPPHPLNLELELQATDLDPFAPAYRPKDSAQTMQRQRDRNIVEQKLNEAAMVVEELERKKKLQQQQQLGNLNYKNNNNNNNKKKEKVVVMMNATTKPQHEMVHHSTYTPTTSGSEESENGRVMGIAGVSMSVTDKMKTKNKNNNKSTRGKEKEKDTSSNNSDSNKSEMDLILSSALLTSTTSVCFERSVGIPSTSESVRRHFRQEHENMLFPSVSTSAERKRCSHLAKAPARSKKCKKEEEEDKKKNSSSSSSSLQPSLECLSDEVLHKIMCHLDPASAVSMKATNKHFKEIIEEGLVWRNAMENFAGEECTAFLSRKFPEMKMEDMVKQVVTLENLKWSSRRVGGKVSPKRCNFASCAAGSKIFLFGGDHLQQALNDTFVLDMASSSPEWKKVQMKSGVVQPPGRFGHTMRALDDKTLVLFGGCGNSGLFDDTYVLRLGGEGEGEGNGSNGSQAKPQWRQIKTKNNPEGRVWHASCVVQETKLVVFGGCDNVGELLDDMHVLDLSFLKKSPLSDLDDHSLVAEWKKVETGWSPPARIGHSLTVTEDAQVLCFGGLANAGPVRARDNSSFIIDLGSKEPRWTKLQQKERKNSSSRQNSGRKVHGTGTGTGVHEDHNIHHNHNPLRSLNLNGGGGRKGSSSSSSGNNGVLSLSGNNVPPARLEHVCWKLPGNRQMIFGGSPSMFGSSEVKFSETSKSDMFLLQTSSESESNNNISNHHHHHLNHRRGGGGLASWKKVSILGEGPQSAWTHCACVMDHGTRCVVLGGSKGQDWLVNELYELKIINPTIG